MAHVKGSNPPKLNPAKDRLLQLADVIRSPAEPATLALVERAFGLYQGEIKDNTRRGRIASGLADKLLANQQRAGVQGLTLDWLHRKSEAGPRKRGVMPPSGPQDARSGPEATRLGVKLTVEQMEAVLREIREYWGLSLTAPVSVEYAEQLLREARAAQRAAKVQEQEQNRQVK